LEADKRDPRQPQPSARYDHQSMRMAGWPRRFAWLPRVPAPPSNGARLPLGWITGRAPPRAPSVPDGKTGIPEVTSAVTANVRRVRQPIRRCGRTPAGGPADAEIHVDVGVAEGSLTQPFGHIELHIDQGRLAHPQDLDRRPARRCRSGGPRPARTARIQLDRVDFRSPYPHPRRDHTAARPHRRDQLADPENLRGRRTTDSRWPAEVSSRRRSA